MLFNFTLTGILNITGNTTAIGAIGISPVPSGPSGPSGPGTGCGEWMPTTFTSHNFAERAYMEFENVPADHARKNNVSAVHSKDFAKFKYHNFEIKKSNDSPVFKTQVYDSCFDLDCDSCCTNNMKSQGTNFLIDLYTGLAKEMYGTEEILVKGWYRDCGSFKKPASLV